MILSKEISVYSICTSRDVYTIYVYTFLVPACACPNLTKRKLSKRDS